MIAQCVENKYIYSMILYYDFILWFYVVTFAKDFPHHCSHNHVYIYLRDYNRAGLMTVGRERIYNQNIQYLGCFFILPNTLSDLYQFKLSKISNIWRVLCCYTVRGLEYPISWVFFHVIIKVSKISITFSVLYHFKEPRI